MAEPRQILDNAARLRMERNRINRGDALELEHIRRYRNSSRDDIGDPEGSYEASNSHRIMADPRALIINEPNQIPSRVSPSSSIESTVETTRAPNIPAVRNEVNATPRRGVFAGEVNEPEPVLSRANADQENPAPSVSGRGRTGEVNEVMRSRAASRGARLPNTRMSPSAARGSEMSADDLNAMSLSRGVGADNSPDTTAAANIRRRLAEMGQGMKKGGAVKKMAKGGMVKAVSASRRGDGCASKGKTKGRMV